MKRNENKQNTTLEDDVWNESAASSESESTADEISYNKTESSNWDEWALTSSDYDIEGLKTDFPTAKELEQFVFDKTGISLNLRGRSNELKYKIALETLCGKEPDLKYVSTENPHINQSDFVPQEKLKPIPERDKKLPPLSELQNVFISNVIPHPHKELRNLDAKVDVIFRKYTNGVISYEVAGPLERQPRGETQDKFGRIRPAEIVWVDPRTGEQMLRDRDGVYTARGQKLRAKMVSLRVNNSNQFDTWIDRDFISINQQAIDDPWRDE